MNSLIKSSLFTGILLLVPLFAQADQIAAPTSGSRTLPILSTSGGGLTETGLLPNILPYTMSWSVTSSGGVFHYNYSFNNLAGLGSLLQGNIFLQTGGASIANGGITNLAINGGLIDTILGASAQDYSNPLGTHDSGILITAPASLVLLNNFNLSFDSSAAPVWGDYAQGSLLNLLGYITNTSFGTSPTAANSPFTNFVATPGAAVPEPATYLILGSTLALAFVAQRRRTASEPVV